MKPKAYVETSVLSYVVSRPSRDVITAARQVSTRRWWENERGRYELLVSEVVLAECRRGDKQSAEARLRLLEETTRLSANESIMKLLDELLVPGAMPKAAAADAEHVATATVYHCDYLLTWNLRHIANARVRRVIEGIINANGYKAPTICTPEELL